MEIVPITPYPSSCIIPKRQGYEEFSEVVSDVEDMSIKNFKRIVIREKSGKGVPVLFSKNKQDHLKVLLKYRSVIMKKPNLYLFGNPNTGQPIIGYKVLKKYVSSCGAKNPDAITYTRLREYLGTFTQLLNLSENDMEQLANFMGHTLGIHRSSYRLPDDIYQTAKISKLLLLMEKGRAAQFKGKSLDDTNLDTEKNLLENLEDDIEERLEEKVDETELQSEDVNRFGGNINIEGKNINKETTRNIETAKHKKRLLTPWTEDQKKVSSFFNKLIESKKPRKKVERGKLIKMHSHLLNNKDWLKIKMFIQNKYTNKLK